MIAAAVDVVVDHRDDIVAALAVAALVAAAVAPVSVVVAPVERARLTVYRLPDPSTARGIARQVTLIRRRPRRRHHRHQMALVLVVAVLVAAAVDAAVVAVHVVAVVVVAAPGPRLDTGPVGLDRQTRNYRLF